MACKISLRKQNLSMADKALILRIHITILSINLNHAPAYRLCTPHPSIYVASVFLQQNQAQARVPVPAQAQVSASIPH